MGRSVTLSPVMTGRSQGLNGDHGSLTEKLFDRCDDAAAVLGGQTVVHRQTKEPVGLDGGVLILAVKAAEALTGGG